MDRGANLRGRLKQILGHRPETYYALIQLDGDHMGKWFAGTERPRYRDLWHSKVTDGVHEQAFRDEPSLVSYLDTRAPASPSYHAALSRTLSDLATSVFPTVVEEAFLGKVLYAGGDDLLAMASVDELFDLMAALRAVYSGLELPGELGLDLSGSNPLLKLGGGHVQIGLGCASRLHRTMGPKATLSMGVVVAHHKTPLQSALRELRARERAAKDNGRDSFSIALMKRAGGTTHFTAKWNLGPDASGRQSAISVLARLRGTLTEDLSRRASYAVIDWLSTLEGSRTRNEGMLAASIAWLFARKDSENKAGRGGSETKQERRRRYDDLARAIASLAVQETAEERGTTAVEYIVNLFRCAEFLARPERSDAGEAEEEVES